MPMFVAPIAGLLSDRIGTRPLMTLGLAMQAIGLGWIAIVTEPTVSFGALIPPFMLAGSGMALVFPTAAATVLASVRPSEAGKASGANNAIREIGGVMGVAVLASVFSANGGYESPAGVQRRHRRRAADRGDRAGGWCGAGTARPARPEAAGRRRRRALA